MSLMDQQGLVLHLMDQQGLVLHLMEQQGLVLHLMEQQGLAWCTCTSWTRYVDGTGRAQYLLVNMVSRGLSGLIWYLNLMD
jgi:hypothetical protein